ncbi:hypothetical protein SAMN02949497_3515 [Methylomagnum ishizawai]|uniref:Major tail protein n=1 Tax=Methylomagnum ishizawai TaxID=1760988 RepID=A0A1Y6D0L0_9GAMM|nr:hypothetical protein [Methylomagnum ishizawai]SMF96131.1 hypothetical protein SAMN02949497_3515 [Methylomagnum ishizawai]
MSGTGLWYKGNLQIAIIGAGYAGDMTTLAFADALNGTKLTIKPDGDKKVRPSTQIEDFGEAKEVRYLKKPTEVEFGFDAVTGDLLAAALLGTYSAYSQGSSTAQTATRTLVLDKWVSLGALNVANVAITGKTLGTDFVVNARLGLVKALNSGTAGSKSITFDVGAVAGDKIVAGTESVIDYALLMEVENSSDGLPGLLEIPKVSVIPGQVFQFLGAKDFQDVNFKGDVIKLPDRDLFTFKPNLVFS